MIYGPLLYIKWRDSNSYLENVWRDIDDYKPRILINETVGWLASETKDAITLVSSKTIKKEGYSSGRRGCGDITILKKAIIKRTLIRMNLP